MSGHSKWSQIKHKKAITDKKKGQIFSRLSHLITIAAKSGLDPEKNLALSQAITRARSENMPKDNIDRAINKSHDKEAGQLEQIVVDALGPGGIAIRIKAVTDNSNRTIAEIRKILGDHYSKMVHPGSIDWMFSTGQIAIADQYITKRIEDLFTALDDNDDVEDVIDNLH